MRVGLSAQSHPQKILIFVFRQPTQLQKGSTIISKPSFIRCILLKLIHYKMRIVSQCVAIVGLASVATGFVPSIQTAAGRKVHSQLNVVGQQAESFGPAQAIRKLKEELPQIEWLAEGEGNPYNKVNMPDYVQEILSQPHAPRREAESEERTHRIRSRFQEAAKDAAALKGMCVGEQDDNAWWRTQLQTPKGGRAVTKEEPLRVLVAGGGLAGLVAAAACHAKGMKVAIFEQASTYAPYGGPIQIQSNALRAIQQINQECYEELVKAGTVTADRVSGLKIGYRKGNKLAGLYDAGDWLVRFDTIGPALEAGLPATVVVDRPGEYNMGSPTTKNHFLRYPHCSLSHSYSANHGKAWTS